MCQILCLPGTRRCLVPLEFYLLKWWHAVMGAPMHSTPGAGPRERPMGGVAFGTLTPGLLTCVWWKYQTQCGVNSKWKKKKNHCLSEEQKGSCQQYQGISVFVILWSGVESFIFPGCTVINKALHMLKWAVRHRPWWRVFVIPAENPHMGSDWVLAEWILSVPVYRPGNRFPCHVSLLGDPSCKSV